jgi:hypothetical protein
MSRIVVVSNTSGNTNNSNYKIQVATGGTITLDTQANGGAGNYGSVVIKGNLDVLGSTTYIESTNSTIKDNIIQLNAGDTTNAGGITSTTAGLEIERGLLSPAQFLFNESINHWDEFSVTLTTVKITGTGGQFSCDANTLIVGATVTITGSINAGSIVGYTSPKTYYISATNGTTTFTLSTAMYNGQPIVTTSSGATALTAAVVVNTGADLAGSFQLKTVDGKLSSLALETITNAGGTTDIVFDMRNTSKVLTIANGSTYANNVIRDGDIPNYKFLQNYVASTFTNGVQGNAIVGSIEYPYTTGSSLATANTSIQTGSTSITFQAQVASVPTTIGTMTNAGFFLGNVRVGGNLTPNTVSGTGGNNLILTAASSAAVEVSGYLTLDNLASPPTYVTTGGELYASATIGAGKTGIYFVNSANYNDELIAKNRALLLSILF